MKKTNRLISLVLCAVMVLTLVPFAGIIEAAATENTVTTAAALKSYLQNSSALTVKVTKDINETVTLSQAEVWAVVAGKKTLDLNGCTVKITVKENLSNTMILVPVGAELTVTDTSSDKSGELKFDADIVSGNPRRNRIVLQNNGKLTVYGGSINPGHYESFYSAKYAKTVYKMTTGTALENYGECTIYGGQFIGRDGSGCSILNGTNCPLTIYDAFLYTKGGASALNALKTSDVKVYSIKADLNKEDAVEEYGKITKGSPYGTSGIYESMLVGDYKVKTQKNSGSGNTIQTATLLEIVPTNKGTAAFSDGTTTTTFAITEGGKIFFPVNVSSFTKNPVNLKDTKGNSVSGIYWDYVVYAKAKSEGDNDWVKSSWGDVTRTDYTLDVCDFRYNFAKDTDYKIVLRPRYIYKGWSHSYYTDYYSAITIMLKSGDGRITFDANGGSVSPSAIGYLTGKKIGLLPVPTYANHEFLGWFTAKSGGTKYSANTVINESINKTLYAQWKDTTKPTFTVKPDMTTFFNDDSDALDITVAATGGNVKYSWEWTNNVFGEWTKLTDEEMPVVYSDGTNVTFRYKGEIVFNMTLRCTATNDNGSTQVQTQITTRLFDDSSEADLADQFLLYVEDTITVSGRGLVVTGKVASGKLNMGDIVKIFYKGTTLKAQAKSIEMFRKTVDCCEKGDSVGINLVAVDETTINNTTVGVGAALAKETTTLKTNTTVTGTLKLNENGLSGTLKNSDTFQLCVPGSDRTATVSNIGGSCMVAGDTQTGIRLTLPSANPAVMYYGQVMNVKNGGKTYGTFTVTNISNGDTGYAKVTYDYNGGGTTPYKKFSRFADSSLPAYTFIKKNDTFGSFPTPVKDGYVIDKWTMGSSTVKIDTKVTGDCTVKANYKTATQIKLTFNSNGADSCSATELNVTAQKTYGKLPTAKKEGYVFIGWFDVLGNRAVEGGNMAYVLDHTLIAQWEEELSLAPVFSKNLSDTCELINKIGADGKINAQFSVEANENSTYIWYIQLSGSKEWAAVGEGASFNLNEIPDEIIERIKENGATIKAVATSDKGVAVDSALCTLTFTMPTFKKGDIDNNGSVTVDDARIALRESLKKTNTGYDFGSIYSREFLSADADNNGVIDLVDARLILRVAIGIEKF